MEGILMSKICFETLTELQYPSGIGEKWDYFYIEPTDLPTDWDVLSLDDKYTFLNEGGYWHSGYATDVINEYGKIVDVDENGEAGEQDEVVCHCTAVPNTHGEFKHNDYQSPK
jgi:hypothetical protein